MNANMGFAQVDNGLNFYNNNGNSLPNLYQPRMFINNNNYNGFPEARIRSPIYQALKTPNFYWNRENSQNGNNYSQINNNIAISNRNNNPLSQSYDPKMNLQNYFNLPNINTQSRNLNNKDNNTNIVFNNSPSNILELN